MPGFNFCINMNDNNYVTKGLTSHFHCKVIKILFAISLQNSITLYEMEFWLTIIGTP